MVGKSETSGIEEKQSWDFLPLAFDIKNQACLVVGSTEHAARKVELLLRAGATVTVLVDQKSSPLQQQFSEKKESLTIQESAFKPSDLQGKALVVAASIDNELNKKVSDFARQRHLPVNVVSDPDNSSFVFPSIIDRKPIMVAVSSSGDSPVLTRLLRNRLESTIPHGIGRLAELAGEFRQKVRDKFPHINQRRRFWERYLEGKIADLVYAGRADKAKEELEQALQDTDMPDTGEVYLVGAGPGDPDLLTFRALRLMRQADVVLYDRLVAEPILDLTRRDAERINVGKARSNHTLPQQDINQLLVTLAKQGKRVLRLKGGDPFIFGRGGEEIDSLAEENIPFQVVPGITAASGCAAYSGIPLTHRDFSQSVRFVTGHLKNNTCDLPWHEFVQENQTLVFYMGLVGLPIITKSLVEHGMSPLKPIALVSRGTTPKQEVIVGTLGDIADQIAHREVHGPTIIIIGDVVTLRDKLNWMK